uniref:C1q domain-containing protein n=1 Tax=Sinocyclocheilus anshuiensis TaxID=1608454 RepID=A0A671R6S1_9TELE
MLNKLTTMEKRMESMENEMERLKTENKEQAEELMILNKTTVEPNIKMDELMKQNQDAYDPNTGIFTAPVRGAYAFRVFSKAFGSPERDVTAGLFKNDQHIISTHGHQASGFISSSNGVSLLLEEGDQMKVNLYPGQWIFDNGEHHSTFSGHLLFPM